jgi:ATP-dependent helicase/DNAse subunit B
MPPDKYTAVWVSHTSISDWLKCPRAYFLKNVYRDPKTKHKIKLMTPSLALGQSVHEVLESLSVLPRTERFREPLPNKFEIAWDKVRGERGGFVNDEVEYQYKKRGLDMLARVYNHPGPINNLSVKIQMDLPYYWLSQEDNIILCGKVDWLEYLPDTDSVHIIDFKTGKHQEEEKSLQLPIYSLLVANCQKRKTTKASYWYLSESDSLTEKPLPNLEESQKKILDIAQQIKIGRQLNRFKCQNGEEGCFTCRPFVTITNGGAKLVGQDEYGADVYILDKAEVENRDGEIL